MAEDMVPLENPHRAVIVKADGAEVRQHEYEFQGEPTEYVTLGEANPRVESPAVEHTAPSATTTTTTTATATGTATTTPTAATGIGHNEGVIHEVQMEQHDLRAGEHVAMVHEMVHDVHDLQFRHRMPPHTLHPSQLHAVPHDAHGVVHYANEYHVLEPGTANLRVLCGDESLPHTEKNDSV